VGVSYDQAIGSLRDAVEAMFRDERVRSVGIGPHEGGYGFHVVRNAALPVPLSGGVGPQPLSISQVPITYHDRTRDVEALVKVPASGPGSPGAASLVPEQLVSRPLVCGLQIENYDNDVRTHVIASGSITIGTLGCFVALADGAAAILSNNHVVAGENGGINGTDRIMQPGDGTPTQHEATLEDFVPLKPSPPGSSPSTGTAILNEVDAGVARLLPGVAFRQAYLPSRHLAAPAGTGTVSGNERVYKVGRTTGLTYGTVASVANVVGPVPYAPGPCWFRRSITVNGVGGTMFSDHGDSGSAVIKESTGEVIGVLYAGNGVDTYICPIGDVLSGLNCSLI